MIKEPLTGYHIPGLTPELFAAETALKLEDIISEHKIRDWTKNPDVNNVILNELEDYLFSLKGRYELAMDLDLIERITHQVLAIAKYRDGK